MAKLLVLDGPIVRMMKMTPEKLGDEAQRAAIKSAQRPRLSLLGIGGLTAGAGAIWVLWRSPRQHR